MKKGILKVLTIGSLGIVLGMQNAVAGVLSVELLGNATYSLATGSPTPTATFGYPGGGLNLNLNLGSKIAFQVGGHYVTTYWNTGTNNITSTIDTNAGFKFMFSREFSLIARGYYSLYRTNPLSLSTPNEGVEAGLGFALPLSSSIDLYFNPMYRYPLIKATYGVGNTLTPSEIIGYIGIVIGGGSKN